MSRATYRKSLLLLGQDPDKSKYYVGWEKEGHALLCAPTGSGKGVGWVIPNALAYPGSLFVTDIKGENFAIAAPARQAIHGSEVHLFNPFGLLSEDASRFEQSLPNFHGSSGFDVLSFCAQRLNTS